MSRALFVLYNDEMRTRAIELIRRAPKETRVSFQGPRRSLESNAKMWAMLTDVSRQVDWYQQKLTAEDWKDVFTASLRKARVVPGIDGGFVPLGMRTSNMSKAEMSALIELMFAFGAEHGVRWSDPNEAPAPAPREEEYA